jgi:hypothetical protein
MPARRDRVIVLVCRPPDSRNSPMGRWPGFRREERDPLTARGAMSGTASASITALPTAPSGGPPTTRRGNPQVPDTLRDKHRRPGRAGNRQYPRAAAHSAPPRGPDSHLTWQRPASGLRSALYLGISSTRPRLLSVSDNFRTRGSGRSRGAHELPRRKRFARSQPARYPTWTPLIQHKTSGQRPWRGYRRQPVPSRQAGHRPAAASGNSPRVPRR